MPHTEQYTFLLISSDFIIGKTFIRNPDSITRRMNTSSKRSPLGHPMQQKVQFKLSWELYSLGQTTNSSVNTVTAQTLDFKARLWHFVQR